MHASGTSRYVKAANALRPVLAVRVTGGAGEQRVEVRLPAMGGPCLHAVDDKLVAVNDRPGAQGRGIGATGGLRQAISAQLATAKHVRQPPVPLLCRARGGDREAGQGVYAHAEPDRQPGACQFLHDLQVGLVRLASATDFLGIRQAEQAGPSDRLELGPREPAVPFGGGHARPQLAIGKVADETEQRGSRVVSGFPLHTRH